MEKLPVANEDMGVKISATKAQIDNYFLKCLRIIHEELVNTFSYAGEQCVQRIRSRSQDESWIDQTGNLRSSIGYAVYADGRKAVISQFGVVLSGSQGPAEAKRYIDELSQKYADTYALVVVAGMNYADEVEALENKDVLASTELWARSQMEGYMKKTRSRIEKRLNELEL